MSGSDKQLTTLASGKPILLTAMAAFLLPVSAHAACTSPTGNAGEMIYGSNNVMAYCNGTTWQPIGLSSAISIGAVTAGDLCTALSPTQIVCTTAGINLSSQVTGILPPANGGTGVANGTNTLTLGGNVQTAGILAVAGAYGVTLTVTGTTNITLPLSGHVVAVNGTPAQGSLFYYDGSGWANLGAGTAGNFLQTQGSSANPQWAVLTIAGASLSGLFGVAQGGTGIMTQFTQGSVVFAGTNGVYTQDNANFFYDATNHRLGVGTASPTANLTVKGVAASLYGSDYTTTGNQSAVALGSASSVRYAGTAAAIFYGIAAGVNGQILNLHNASGYTLTLANQSALETTVANRIVTGLDHDLVLEANSAAELQYDGTSNRWRVAGASALTAAGSSGQVQFDNAGVMGADSALFWDNTNKYLGIGTTVPAYNVDAGTGALAGLVVRVSPQTLSMVAGVSVGNAVIGSASANQFAYFMGPNTIVGTSAMNVGTSGVGIGTTIPTAALTVSGVNAFMFGADYTTAGAQADINFGPGSAFRYAGAGAATFYGIVAGVGGQFILLHNATNYNVILANESASESTTVNRIATGVGADFTVSAGAAVLLQYDGTSGRWRIVGGSGAFLGTSATVANPLILGDATTGLYTPAGSTVAVTTGGTERLRVTSTGVGIGGAPSAGLDLHAKSDALALPVGTTGSRPSKTGAVRYNSTTTRLEANINGTWSMLIPACSTPDVQTFLASGTWTKPTCGSVTKVECWGGGGSGGTEGSKSYSGGGGGGGAFNTIILATPSLTSTVTVTVGAGGASVGGDTNGNPGGTSSFGTYFYVYGGSGGYGWANNASTCGGGGGGQTSAGVFGSPGTGGGPLGGGQAANSVLGGGGGACSESVAGSSVYGGGGGGGKATGRGGDSIYGGGGGSALTITTYGTSVYGGNGGAGGIAYNYNAGAGSQPGGGGGAASNDGYSGKGGDGKCIVTTW